MTLTYRMLAEPPHAVAVQLDPDQALWCLSQRVVFATASIEVGTRLSRPSPSGSVFSRLTDAGRRLVGGEASRVRWVSAQGASGVVGLADPWGGQLLGLELTDGAGWRVRPDRVLAAESSVTVTAGEGFDRLAGHGTLLVSATGHLLEVDPARHGGTLQVAADRLIAHEATVVARDGGGGVLELHGPGRVLLDTIASGPVEDDGVADRPRTSWGEEIGMDLLAKAKEAAEKAAALAADSLAQGQSRVEEFQSQRHEGSLLRELGSAYWSEQREGGDHEAVIRVMAALDAHVVEHGPVSRPEQSRSDKPGGGAPQGTAHEPDGDSGPQPTGSTLGDL